MPIFTKESRTTIFLTAISLSQGLLSGLGTVWGYIYKDDFHLSPALASSFDANLRIPWMLKPVFGLLSDNFPIFGYKRLSYLLLSSLSIWLSLFYFGTISPTLALGLTFLALNNIGQATQSVLGQAILVENAQEICSREDVTKEEKAKAASKGVSLYYGMKIAGSTLFSLLIASLLTEEGRRGFLFYSSFIPGAIFLSSFLLPETRKKKKADLLIENIGETDQREITGSERANNLKKVWRFLKDPLMLQAMFLMFLTSFLPGSGQANFYFFTNKLGFKPDFLGTLNIIASFATMLGVFIYNKFFATINLKTFYSFSQTICALLSLCMIILYKRWNVAWGISDEIFMVGDSFATSIIGEINSLPILILACRLCPKNIEATVFSILSAIQSMSGILSSQLGAYLLFKLNITADNFDNLEYMPIVYAGFQMFSLVVLWCSNIDTAIAKVDEENKKHAIENHVEVMRRDVDEGNQVLI